MRVTNGAQVGRLASMHRSGEPTYDIYFTKKKVARAKFNCNLSC
jgi:hypothetical protein